MGSVKKVAKVLQVKIVNSSVLHPQSQGKVTLFSIHPYIYITVFMFMHENSVNCIVVSS